MLIFQKRLSKNIELGPKSIVGRFFILISLTRMQYLGYKHLSFITSTMISNNSLTMSDKFGQSCPVGSLNLTVHWNSCAFALLINSAWMKRKDGEPYIFSKFFSVLPHLIVYNEDHEHVYNGVPSGKEFSGIPFLIGLKIEDL